MIDTIRLTFLALRADGRPEALRVLQLPDDERVLLGLDENLRPHLIVAVDGAQVPETGVATLDVVTRSLMINGRQRSVIDVTCLFEALAEVFDHFVAAVIERLTQQDVDPGAAVADVLENWRRFLTPATGPPGRETLTGVFGELLVLADVVRRDPARRIDIWTGPHGARHDLRRGVTAIEVKTTRSHTRREVSINGEDQLLEPDGGTLHLHFIRLEEAPEHGRSVAALVDDLLGLGVTAEPLFAALERSGVPPADIAETEQVRFDVRERLTFPVDDQSPRIVPHSFAGQTRPLGVTSLEYCIDLDHVLDRALTDDEFDSLIKGLAGTASQ